MQEREVARGETEVGGPDEFGLAHRYAADDLAQVLTESRGNQQMLGFAEPAAAVERRGMGCETAQRRCISSKPSEPMSGVLVMLERFGGEPAIRHQARRKLETCPLTKAIHTG